VGGIRVRKERDNIQKGVVEETGRLQGREAEGGTHIRRNMQYT
jgi:hypothetical protein